MLCELCGGKQARSRVRVEGTMMHVCQGCASYGLLVRDRPSPKAAPTTPETVLASDFGRRVRRAREERNLSQMMLARALHEKESVIHQVESGSLRPTEQLARKLERFLDIKLYEKLKKPAFVKQGRAAGLTLGDLMK